jgi:phosphatidate cytidylyltransferase
MMFGLLYKHPMAIIGLALLIQFLCIKEFMQLMAAIFPDAVMPQWLSLITQMIGALVVITIPMLSIEPGYIVVLMMMPAILLLATILHKRSAVIGGLSALAALLYIAMPMGMLVTLRGNLHFSIPLALILMIWMNDTMAYIVGSFIGKSPFSAISPKKTWEGTAGGALLAVAGAAIWGYYSPLPQYRIVDWVALSICAAVAGTAGDLLESKLKRMAGVKDSGRIMPGHGGALDRFDSLLITLPFAFAYAMLFMS